jgi:hypothetical protein
MFHLVTTRFRDNRLQPIVLPPYAWQAHSPSPMLRGTMAGGRLCGFARGWNVSKGIPCPLSLHGKSLMSFRGAASIGGLGGSRFVEPPRFCHWSFRAVEVMHSTARHRRRGPNAAVLAPSFGEARPYKGTQPSPWHCRVRLSATEADNQAFQSPEQSRRLPIFLSTPLVNQEWK